MKITILILATLAVASLEGCKQTGAPILPISTDISQLRQAEDARGGPKTTCAFKSSKIDESLDPKYKELTPGSIQATGLRVAGGSNIQTGVVLFIMDSTYPSAKSLKTAKLYLDKSEVSELNAAFSKENEYLQRAAQRPPQHSEDVSWKSVEGLIFGAEVDDGKPSFYLSVPNQPGREGFGLTLNPEAAKQVITSIEAAENLAEQGT